ncbi:MAG TPA: DUF4230 domain-containing protein [Verrucomicrobiae bacterium]|nr:DUF4230 domain-containing protein [Verrucomicrobiae bacterium]
MLKKAAIAVSVLAIIFAAGLFLGAVFYRFVVPQSPRILNTATLLKKVQTLSQFVTVKYNLEKVVVLDDLKWYGDSHVTLVAHGVVKAAINLDQLTPNDFQISGSKISIDLPRSRVVDAYLDDQKTQIVERSTGVLRIFDKDLEQNARRQAVEELRLAALQNGILDQASERARSQLALLFYQAGFTEVEVRTKSTINNSINSIKQGLELPSKNE